jgi:recombinational DNA repair protein (RecF pathway)
LREVSLRRAHEPLRKDLAKLQQASYCTTLVEQTTETETALPGEFDLLNEFLLAVAGVPVNPASVLAFELKLLAHHGQSPDLNSMSISEGTRRVVERLTQGNWEGIARLRPSQAQIVEISRFLHDFMIYHVGRVPRGRGAALDLKTA